MAIVTISRGSFSGGKMLAECLADTLGYRCVDRDVIVEKAAAYGVPQEEIQDALTRPPTFWERFGHKKYMYLALVQAALAEEVRQGNTVYHGHAGHLLLRGVSHVVRARTIAPMPFRAAMVKARLKLSEAEAVAYIERADQDRRRWTHYLYGVEWGDPSLYDLVLNLEVIDIMAGCEIIAAVARQKYFEETPASQAAMEDLVLASRVRATLATTPDTSHLEVEVVARDGTVSIEGKVQSVDQLRELEAIVRAIPGVIDVTLNLYSASPV